MRESSHLESSGSLILALTPIRRSSRFRDGAVASLSRVDGGGAVEARRLSSKAVSIFSIRNIDEYPIKEYLGGMKVNTSVTLSPETLRAIDEIAGELLNRSRVIEQAVLEFIERRRRAARDARDLEILNRSADVLNEEVEDILGYQIEL